MACRILATTNDIAGAVSLFASPEERLPAWVFAIARNAIADHFRRNSKPVESLPDDFDVATEQEGDPEATAVNELSRCLEPMIEALPPPYRSAIRLTELEGMTQSEAAAHERLSVSGMKTRVQRG
jgi:RNA polymerase sigma-70 factor (ECF subfamily)